MRLSNDNEPSKLPVMRRSNSGILKIDDETNDGGAKPQRIRRNVSFTSLDIHEFDMELGDNPCAVGVPVQLGEKRSSATFTLDTYERMKPKAKDRSDMVLSRKVRSDIVRGKGTPRDEVRAMLRETKEIQLRRIQSVGNMKWDKWDYQKERIGRSLKKVTTLGRSRSSPELAVLVSSRKEVES